jgi:hypothetical protein
VAPSCSQLHMHNFGARPSTIGQAQQQQPGAGV